MSNGPPTNIEPRDLWMQITALPRPHRVVDFPRKGPSGEPVAQVAIVPLTQHESYAGTVETERFVRKMLKGDGLAVPGAGERSEGYTTLYENRAAVEVLFRACKRADDVTKNFFPTVEAIAQGMTVDEIGVLFRLYLSVCGDLGPVVSQMSQEEMDAWIDRLVEGGGSDPLAFLTAAAKIDLILYMARQCSHSRTDNSSPGEQQDSQ